MVVPLEAFSPKHNYLICFDSDGTVMDTMAVKHGQCLCPALIEVWGLEKWETPVTQLWHDINLHQITRGLNRFKALALVLRAVNDQYTPVDGLPDLEAWISSGATLSGDTLGPMATRSHSEILKKAFQWTEIVNEKIGLIPLADKKPFPSAAKGLKAAAKFADIAVISTANRNALLDEWGEYDLLDYADLILAQDSGSKEYCIRELLKKGYSPTSILMVGDAPGDMEAAKQNGVCFFPMLCGHEKECWIELIDTGYSRFQAGGFDSYEKERVNAFLENLGVRQG